jgi:hypothetical protein
MTHIEQLREQITNTLIANECALDHVTGGAPAAKEIPIPGTERVMYIGRRADVERLLATTAGEQAEPTKLQGYLAGELAPAEPVYKVSDVAAQAAPASPEQVQRLTEAQIFAALASVTHEVPVRLPPGWLKFARAIERMILAAPIAAAPAAEEVQAAGEAVRNAVHELIGPGFHVRLAAFDFASVISAAMKRAASTEGEARDA